MKIVIVGAGDVGSHLAKMLSHEGREVTVIDSDPAKLAKLTATADVAATLGSATSISVLKNAGAQNADLFISVVASANQEVNLVSAMLAKSLGAQKVMARIHDEDFLSAENKLRFKEMGVEVIFFPEKIAADDIVERLRKSSAIESLDFVHGKLQITVFKLDEDSKLLDMKVSDFASLASQDDLQFRIIAIARGEKTVIPRFDTKFQYHDLVYVITKREGLPELMDLFGKTNAEVEKLMIFGGSDIAEMVARSLSKKIQTIKIIEKDKERCLELSERLDDNIIIANGDGRNSDFLLEESIREYDAFVALTDSDETNIMSCVVAKKLGVERTIAEVENTEYVHLAEEMGIDSIINKKLITAGRIFKFTLSGKARFVKYISGTDAEVLEYTVAPGSAITKAPLKEIGFPDDAIIGGVIRGSESIIAVGDTLIEAYDRVAVFALPNAVKEVDKFFK